LLRGSSRTMVAAWPACPPPTSSCCSRSSRGARHGGGDRLELRMPQPSTAVTTSCRSSWCPQLGTAAARRPGDRHLRRSYPRRARRGRASSKNSEPQRVILSAGFTRSCAGTGGRLGTPRSDSSGRTCPGSVQPADNVRMTDRIGRPMTVRESVL
jgi:hypothetical protein